MFKFFVGKTVLTESRFVFCIKVIIFELRTIFLVLLKIITKMTVVYIYNLNSVDDPPVSKLNVGEYNFGRGDLLKCDDPRVSRNHGVINIKENSVTITSTHQNPCFYQSIDNSTITILPKNSPITVTDGDKFALLADQFWFRIQFETYDREKHRIYKRDESNVEVSCSNQIQVPLKRNIQDEPGPSNDKKPKFDEDKYEVSSVIDCIKEDEFVIDSVNNQDDIKEASQNNQSMSSMKNNAELRAILFNSDEDEQSESEEPVKNINDTSQTMIQNSDAPSVNNTKIKKQLRDRCWYGSSCYRKSSAHLVKYSHPGNSDYDSDPNDDRPICAYKASCYRRNKEHRQAYKHPNGLKNTNNIPTNIKRTDRINYNDSSEDDCLFVDSGSEYEANSVSNDETDSDWDELEEEKEETKRLVKEAKRFTEKKNKD